MIPTESAARTAMPSAAAYYHDIFVGVVGGFLEPFPEAGAAAKKLYLPVLAVLAPYRGRGIGEPGPREPRGRAPRRPGC